MFDKEYLANTKYQLRLVSKIPQHLKINKLLAVNNHLLLLSDMGIYMLDPYYIPVFIAWINKPGKRMKYTMQQQMKDCIVFTGPEHIKIVMTENNRLKITKIQYIPEGRHNDNAQNSVGVTYSYASRIQYQYNIKEECYRPKDQDFFNITGGISIYEMSNLSKGYYYKFYKYKLQILQLVKDLKQ